MQFHNPIAKIAPPRPKTDKDGVTLQYRTHISKPNPKYDIFDPLNVTVQVHLYRWVRSEDYVPFVSIADLWTWLFSIDHPEISKRHLGTTILQAIRYDPRRVKGATKDNPVACASYYFENRLDLQYGLEWMISLWIAAVNDDATDPESTELIFDDLAACEDPITHYIEMMEDPEVREELPVFSWADMWEKREWRIEDPIRPKPVRPEKLRGLTVPRVW